MCTSYGSVLVVESDMLRNINVIEEERREEAETVGGRKTTGEKHLNEQNKCFDFNSCLFAEQLRSREASQQAETFQLHSVTLRLHLSPLAGKTVGLHMMSRHSVAMAQTADGGREVTHDT